MNPTACPGRDRLQQWLDGGLPAEDEDALERHVSECPFCQQALDLPPSLFDPRPGAGAWAEAGEAPDEQARRPANLAFLAPAEGPGEIGRLASYRVIQIVGEGGMGLVFRGEDVRLKRPVALKVMRPELARNPLARMRFLREARATAAVRNDHVVTIYHVGKENELPFLAMEFLVGETLAARREREPRPPLAEILRIGRETCEGLEAAHKGGLIHRDVKPSNLWLEAPSGRVKILDFGLARSTKAGEQITRAGQVMGTPAYMSPEQAKCETLDHRCDLFSLGSVLYELCAGTHPFERDSTQETLAALVLDQPKPLREQDASVPPDLATLVQQMLAKKPEDRPASAAEVARRIASIENEAVGAEPSPERRAGRSSKGKEERAARAKTRNAAAPEGFFRRRRGWKIALTSVLAALLAFSVLRIALKFLGPGTQAKAYLSDMEVTDATNWPFRGLLPSIDGLPEDLPPTKSIHPVVIKGKVSPHGIFMHGPRSRSAGSVSIVYRLGKKHALFVGDVSLNDGPRDFDGKLTFHVIGDGKTLWTSKPVKSQRDAQTFRIPVAGVDEFKIVMEVEGEGRGSQGVWIEPRFE